MAWGGWASQLLTQTLSRDDTAGVARSTPAARTATIALTRFQEPDWLVGAALRSACAQHKIEAEVLFLDQSPSKGMASTCAGMESEHCRVHYRSIPAKCLSFARNVAVNAASSDLVLFLDADAVAEPSWAFNLCEALAKDAVALAGARVLPRWHRTPMLLAASHVIQDQYSIFDLGQAQMPFSRVVGAGFGLHRARLGSEAHFDERLGRRPGQLLGGEESDLARRALGRGLRILYEGRALVYHQILPERISYRWILRRMFYAGFSRALLTGAPKPSRPLSLNDYVALPVVLPFYALGYFCGKAQAQRQANVQA